MLIDDNGEKIEQFAKEYFTSKNIDFMPKHEKDRCYLDIRGKYGLFYVEATVDRFVKYLNPGDEGYPVQAGGLICPLYSGEKGYMFVCDLQGNIILDVSLVKPFCHVNFNHKQIFLDKENMLVPVQALNTENDIQHIRIKNSQAEVITTFYGGKPCGDERLFKNKLITFNGQLYDFSKGSMIGRKFDSIISCKYDLEKLAREWHIPCDSRDNEQEEFIEQILRKFDEENIFGGFKRIRAEKDREVCSYGTFVFINRDGEIVSDLYYMDGDNFVSASVDNNSYSTVVSSLYEKADQEVLERISKKW